MVRIVSFLLALGALASCGSVPDEVSVKPGINDTFLSPDLDVDQMVQRFETESREIAAQRDRIVAAVGLEPGDSVADIGAGTGLFLDPFAQAVGVAGKVYAVDIAERFVAHLAQRARAAGFTQVETVLCTESSAELPEACVDKVFICDTYHHFEYPRSTMTSIHRALKPGGELVVVDFERVEGVTREWILNHVRAGKAQVLRELAAFGFELIEEVDVYGLEENYCIRLRRV